MTSELNVNKGNIRGLQGLKIIYIRVGKWI